MKVLPLVLTLLIVIALSVKEEISSYKTEKKGRITYLKKHYDFREGAYFKEPIRPSRAQPAKGKEEKEGPKLQHGARELNIFPLIDSNEYGKDPEKTAKILQIVEKLIAKHFAISPLYQELIQEEPQLIPRFFEVIREKSSHLDFKIGKAGWSDLALLQLGDEKLQLFLYEFLKGERMPPEIIERAYIKGEKIPLMNSLVIEKRSRPLRLFIASPPLLEALSEKESIAPILEKRKTLSKALRKEKGDRQALNQEWEDFLKREGLYIPVKWISYEISSTKI